MTDTTTTTSMPVSPQASAPNDIVAPVETVAPIEPKEDEIKFGKRFAAITAKERAIKQREAKLKSESQAVREYQEAKKQAKLNPIAYLSTLGLDYRQLTDHVLNDQKPTPEMQIKSLEEQLELDRNERIKEKQSAQERQIQATIEHHKKQIQTLVDSKDEEFELIRANQAYDTVFEVIEAYWQQTGKILPIEEAAKNVEAEYEAHARKLLGLKKFAVKSALEVSPESPQQASKLFGTPRTLTNAATAAAQPQTNELLSREESIRRAARLLRGG